MITKAAIWPVRLSASDGWNVRLGRVVHWISVAAAFGLLMAAVVSIGSKLQANLQAKARATAYDNEHKNDGQFEATMSNGLRIKVVARRTSKDPEIQSIINDYMEDNPLEFDTLEGERDEREITIREGGERPEIEAVDLWSGFALIVTAVCAIAAGRTFRYLLANE